MPIIFVYGLPDDFHDEESLRWKLIDAATEVKELNLSIKDISVFFPSERLKENLGEEIIIIVEGLFDGPERTNEVRIHLAAMLVRAVREYFPRAVIECLVKPFNPELGYCSVTPVISETILEG